MRIVFVITLLLTVQLCISQSYVQQKVNSTIDVELFPDDNVLKGRIKIDYTNNSNITLSEIYFHLWPNGYANHSSAFNEQLLINGNKEFHFETELNRGSITDLSFTVNQQQASFSSFQNYEDIAILTLPQPLQLGETITIETPFTVYLPEVVSRLGVSENIYHITQWFPKPAVLDETGWNPMPYLSYGEYYAEYGKYDVSITLPSNMVVAATGELQTDSEIQWLNELATETKAAIQNNYDLSAASAIKHRNGKKTIRYVQDDIHDFAWFASEEFYLLEDTIEINGEEKTIQSFFPEIDIYLWEQANSNIAYALQFFSDKIGPYPYKNYKAVRGVLGAGGGMEYPMITVLNSHISDLGLKRTLIHEVGHSWFQTIIGNNEREHPWMDESLTSFYTQWALGEEIDADLTKTFSENNEDFQFLHSQPIGLSASEYTHAQYVQSVYGKGTSAFGYLFNYFGEDAFSAAIQAYYKNWRFKHPQPNNLQASFPENLNWFFHDILLEDKPIDYEFVALQNSTATINNKGEVAAPFPISYYDENSEFITEEWFDGFTGSEEIQLTPPANFKIATIFGTPYYYDTNYSNNSRTTANKNPTQLNVITPLSPFKEGFGSTARKELFISPLLGWNAVDKLMVGGTISNTSIVEKPLEYQLIPMYANSTNEVVGLAEVRAHINADNEIVNQWQPYARVRRFHNQHYRGFDLDYIRNEAGIHFDFYHGDAKPNFIDKTATINVVHNLETPLPRYDQTTGTYTEQDYEGTSYLNLQYARSNKRSINPNQLTVNAQATDSFTKLSAEYDYRYDFEKKGEYVKLRAFAGSVLTSKDEMPFTANFSAIGRNGENDYDFSNLYFYRDENSSFANQALTIADGGLKAQKNYANLVELYGKNMFALNGEMTLPFQLPAGKFLLYSDVVFVNKAINLTNEPNAILYDAGVSYQVANFVKLYYPILLSEEFQPETDFEEFNFGEKLIFTFEFNPLDIKHQIRDAIFR